MSTSIIAQINEIQGLKLPELRERWKTLFGTMPPAYSREHFVRRLAYRVQELAHGGLSDATKAALCATAEADGSVGHDGGVARLTRKKANGGGPVLGTTLVRIWRDQRYEVKVVAGGFEMEGRLYKSLSAVAKAVTGQHWNAKLFFGLRARGKKEA